MPDKADLGSLVQVRWRPDNRDIRYAVLSVRAKENVSDNSAESVTGVLTGKNRDCRLASEASLARVNGFTESIKANKETFY